MNSFTPRGEDVGREVTVSLTPINRRSKKRRGDDVVEEVYRFANPVERIPFMPIASPLRDCFEGKFVTLSWSFKTDRNGILKRAIKENKS